MGPAAESRISEIDGKHSLFAEHDAQEVVCVVALRATRTLTPRTGLVAQLAAFLFLLRLDHQLLGTPLRNVLGCRL